MESYFEFEIFETDNERRVIRFYPKTTHVYGFEDEPPKTWDKVYKVYFSFDVIHFDKYLETSKVVFNARCDECSALDTVAELLMDRSFLADPVTEIGALGYATQWVLVPRGNYVLIVMYPLNGGVSYTFSVHEDRLLELAKIISEYLVCALANSEGI